MAVGSGRLSKVHRIRDRYMFTSVYHNKSTKCRYNVPYMDPMGIVIVCFSSIYH